ncbi:enoyl-CoA hydratase/isomerase family protein [Paraconexibacter algicola]|uniref:Enoyl-CoA hydratase n=1 Tax=Paraconexibacter algicola TaxID=2133960 RepID=A0A2T4UGM1_9ACTN|nr:enoyl-CoA hydratase-related protein [Paraconexibacter algicola]PTL58404.1 enoyl-CoA hydratase [Paraconexibacter algicola]
MTDEPPVLLEVRDGVAHLTLNRPEQSNALNATLLEQLLEIVGRLRGDRDVRVVLLTGAGKNFCGGGDVVEFASKGEQLPDHLVVLTEQLGRIAAGLVGLDVPVIAAIQGAATGGGGLGLACAADIVVAGESARFMVAATRVGMAPDAGMTFTLPRLVGLRGALDLALTNPLLSAAEAKELGLVGRVVPDDALADEALALATKLARGPRDSQAETKRLMWAGAGAAFGAVLDDEAATVSRLSGSADAREGLAAVIERRRPEFS